MPPLQRRTLPFEGERSRGEKRADEAARRLQVLKSTQTSWKQRARAVGAAVLPCIDYASWSMKNNSNRTKKLRHQVVQAVHGKIAQGPRCAELLLGGFSAQHTTDLKWSGPWRHIKQWSKQLSLKEDAWQMLRDAYERRSRTNGPYARMAWILTELNVDVDWDEHLAQGHGCIVSLRPGALAVERELHLWRELLRRHEWQAIQERRGDMQGLGHRLDRKALERQQAIHPAQDAALLRMIQSGGIVTHERRATHQARGDGQCFCQRAAAAMQHICWRCDSTRVHWLDFPYDMPEDAAEASCALPLLGRTRNFQDALAANALACWKAWKARAARDETEDAAAAPEQHEELLHMRTPANTIWQDYDTCPGLQIDTHRRFLRCCTCRFTASYSAV